MRRFEPRTRWEAVQALLLYFLLYSVIGWAYEVFLEVVVYRWGYSDRGVLLGPYCPVYGVEALTFLLCFGWLLKKEGGRLFRWVVRPLALFVGCMAVATAIELATSYILEALTGSWPWQTYVDYGIHFQGRIALSPSIRFGLGGLLFCWYCSPCSKEWWAPWAPGCGRGCSGCWRHCSSWIAPSLWRCPRDNYRELTVSFI